MRGNSPQTLVVGALNVRGCSTSESKRCKIGDMFKRRKMDVLALSETKMKGKGETAFGEVSRVSRVERGRAREGVALGPSHTGVFLTPRRCDKKSREIEHMLSNGTPHMSDYLTFHCLYVFYLSRLFVAASWRQKNVRVCGALQNIF